MVSTNYKIFMSTQPGTRWIRLILLAVLFSSARTLWAGDNLRLISARSADIAASAGGTGHSDLPVVSADGRYVAFVSTADNLVLNPYPVPVLGSGWHSLQVFVCDRTTGVTTLVSADPSGAPGKGDSFPAAVSTNGQFVLFESAAGGLVSGDNNNQTDVFLRDVLNQNTVLISVNSNGLAGNGFAHNASMTPDARVIAFSSAATDLVSADTNDIPDVFVRDRIAVTTTLASVGAQSTGSTRLPSVSETPRISADGRFVSYYSSATNLLFNSVMPGQVFVRDLLLGTTACASSNAPGLFQSVFGTKNFIACDQRISADGSHVIFEACTNPVGRPGTIVGGLVLRYNSQTGSTDLIATNAAVPSQPYEDIDALDISPDGRYTAFVAITNSGATRICLWDAQSATTTLVSQNLSGGVTASDACLWPKVDASGRYVAFFATAANLTTNVVSGYNCYLRDVQNGVTTLLNADDTGIGSGVYISTSPAMSDDGRVVAFVAGDSSLVPADNNAAPDVFVRDVTTNAVTLVSAHATGQADISSGLRSGFSTFGISSNAQFVTFTSEAALAATDTNGLRDVYCRDVVNATNLLVSVNTNGVAGSGFSSEPAVDASGRYVVFSSSATDLVLGDTNQSADVFIRDLTAGTTTLVSKDAKGSGEGRADSSAPKVSADARYVLYYSLANNLTAGTFSGQNLFLRDRQLGTNYALTFSGAGAATMTPDGQRVAYVDTSTAKVYVWNTASGKRIYTNSMGTFTTPFISPDGGSVAWFDTRLKIANLVLNTSNTVASGSLPFQLGASFSADGRFLAYSLNVTNVSDSNGLADIYLYDALHPTNILISHSYNSTKAPNSTSLSPAISPDGRFIAYYSVATNVVPVDLNQVPDLFLYDRSNAATLLITASAGSNHTANNRSKPAIFSADGKNLAFFSWASDLVPGDFNQGSDIFLFSLPGSTSTGTTNVGSAGPISMFQMFQPPKPGQAPAFSWAAEAGSFYSLQYKDDLADPVWHDFTGTITIQGNAGLGYDQAPSPTQRFYRVLSGN